jgi:hypothetical protein
MGVQDSRVYLSRQVNNILQVFGSNVKISGLDITINNNNKLINNKIASFTISPGKCIVDTTLHVFPTATTLELDISPYDPSGYLVIVVSYKYIESLQQNRPIFKLLYVTQDGLDQLPDAWSPNRDNLIIGVFKFNNQSPYDLNSYDGNIISVNNNTYTINPISDTIGCQHYLGGSDSEPDCNRCLLSDGDLYFDLVQKELFIYNGWSPIEDTFESNTNYVFESNNNYNNGTILYTLTVVKQGTGDGTVISSPSGINCGSICSYHFISGYSVTLTATPNSTSAFNSWAGDATSINPTVTITMNSNKIVYAIFTINEAGYFTGGNNSSAQNFIDKLLFSNESRSTLAVVLSQSIRNQSACNSTLAGYFSGGVNDVDQSFIDRLLFSNESRSTLATTLSQSIRLQSACNSTLSGYFAGGVWVDTNNNWYSYSYIDKLLFSNESRITLATILSQITARHSACNSTISGYFSGGVNGSGCQSFIDKLLFSNESRITLTTTLSQSIYHQSACNSTLVGYFAGGFNGNYQSYIDKLSFSNETRTTLAAILSVTVMWQSACNSTLSGYFAGGENSNETIVFSFIDKLSFSNESRTTLATTLSQTVYKQSACQSGGIL